jgi:hypothetical protein
MKAHVELAEGRRLPSRYRYAMFRLTAFMILRWRAPHQASSTDLRYVVIIDRDQNPIESFAFSLFLVTWGAAYGSTVATLYWGVRPAVAAGLFPVLFMIMPLVVQAVLYVVAGLMAVSRRAGLAVADTNHAVQTAVLFLVIFVVAAIASNSGRLLLAVLGWIWFALLGLNAAAAVLMRLLSKPVEAAEAHLLEGSSEF